MSFEEGVLGFYTAHYIDLVYRLRRVNTVSNSTPKTNKGKNPGVVNAVCKLFLVFLAYS